MLSIQLIVKVFTEDNSSKTIFVDETMPTRTIVHMLVEKNHYDEKPDYSVVEQIPDLYMGRIILTDFLTNLCMLPSLAFLLCDIF